MSSKQKHLQLSKTISHALRHAPWLYELELDEAGWTPVDDLIQALRSHRKAWQNLDITDIEEMIASSDKQRFELDKDKGRIRAFYGHSLPEKLQQTPAYPPEYLYHGTTDCVIELILKEGLHPMHRQYVHLSTDTETAAEVGKRKRGGLTILQIQARKAHEAGIIFYHGNEMVWLADTIPPDYINPLP